MTTKFVQFSDSTEDVIVALFGCAQDPTVYPNQGELAEDDPRYLTFINPPTPPVVDPVDKLKEFLAANPDVAAILGV